MTTMNRVLLIFILLITFNVNSIAGTIMMSSMDIDMSMSQSCHDMQSATDMVGHCDSDSAQSESCDQYNCGACAHHCSSAIIEKLSSKMTLDSSLPDCQYLPTESLSVYARMLRPPQIV